MPAGADGVPSSPRRAPVAWLRGSGVGWVAWGAGLRGGELAAQPCPHRPACACLHPHTVCVHLPAPARPPIPACALTPPTRACLHPDAACTLTLPTPPTHRLHPPSFPACSCPRGLPIQRQAGGCPPPCRGALSPGPPGQGTEMGIWHQPGTSPLLCPPWGPRVGEHGAGCLTAHSSRLPAPAAGAKPNWILNWKINLDSRESQGLPSPCTRVPAACTPCLPRLPAPSYRWGN